MPKRTKKNRYMKKGGDIFTGTSPPTAQGVTSSAPSALSTWFNDAKKAVSSAADSVSSAANSAANSATSAANSATDAINSTVSQPQRTFGGAMAALIGSPIRTAKPQVWVGGKTRKRVCHKRHKHTKSCKSQTYKKKGNRKKRSRKSKFPFSESLKRLIKM